MRHFLCSNCVVVMLLKVWQDNRRDMSLQRNCIADMFLKVWQDNGRDMSLQCNCVAVMLLKARGWRGTSLPRENDNAWFSNPVRVLLLPMTW